MSRRESRAPSARALHHAVLLTGLCAATAGAQLRPHTEGAAVDPGKNRANWSLADKWSTQQMNQLTYSTSAAPRFLEKSDTAFYNWRDKSGQTWYLVAPNGKKQPLFDHVRMAAQLSQLHKKPYVAEQLPIQTLNFTKDHKKIRFAVDSTRYEFDLAAQRLSVFGAWRQGRDSIPGDEERAAGGGGGRGGGGGGGGQFGPGQGAAPDFRNFSPDSTAFVFAREHNLYFVEVAKGDTVQITKDGERNYSFGFRDTAQTQQRQQDDDQQEQQEQQQGGQANGRDPRVRPNVTWAKDSKAFFVQRQDSRQVKELFLVNSLSEPRPTLLSYKYAMPGEIEVNQSELWLYVRGETAARKLPFDKWKDQRFFQPHWPVDNSTRMRVTRRDRLQRNLELIEYDVAANSVTVLLTESVENAFLESAVARYVTTGGDFIWVSERTGWQHLYLYAHDGTFKRALTEGPWRVMGIAEVDSTKGVVYFNGVGREGDNPYNNHYYKVNLNGTGFAHLTPGPYNHTVALSPNKRVLIDSYSRVDTVPQVVLRDATTGRVLGDLESADLSRLYEMGWKMPSTFTTKAADGVTDIHGNMWLPFDFDSTRKYPIIAYVYPGPQTESVTGGFTAGGVPQQLAQLGFVVIQIGNRGGNPARSNAYHSYGYYNLRDYALADKKTGIEQLASRHGFIDLDRVGIYGHSGGGFLTGAALLLPPYNEFFKVGVSSAGNHDNNIYNQNWSEQHHGLRYVPPDTTQQQGNGARGAAGQAGRGAAGAGGRGAAGAQQQAGRGQTQVLQGRSQEFQIRVPTNHELAANLKGKLLLVHGDMDNNVHPGGTIRLVNALIQQNKRFDMMILPGRAHGFAEYQPYFNQMLMEYFAEHLLGDYYRHSAQMTDKR
jgi:dipeptidyl-peptidase 4